MLGVGTSAGYAVARGAINAISTYNSTLSTTDSMLTTRGAGFSSKSGHTRVGISGYPKGSQPGQTPQTFNIPLGVPTLQWLFRYRMTIARNAGRKYVQ